MPASFATVPAGVAQLVAGVGSDLDYSRHQTVPGSVGGHALNGLEALLLQDPPCLKHRLFLPARSLSQLLVCFQKRAVDISGHTAAGPEYQGGTLSAGYEL